MKDTGTRNKLFSIGVCAVLFGITYQVLKIFPKVPFKSYTQMCLYMAVMDDEICRNELEGNTIEGRKIIFPPKRESLQYRYHLFLKMYKQFSSRQLEQEIKKMEKRLQESKLYLHKESEELQVEF